MIFKTNENPVNILLVDDREDNLLALEGLLRSDDFEIFQAKSGTEALELMISREFALALIDVQMPGMSGFDLAELMRGAKKTKNIPIIFVTATAKDQDYLFKGYETGAVDYLTKPLDAHALRSKVNIFIELYRQKKYQEELVTQLQKTRAELEQAVQIRDEFMSIASHELKTPLTSLKLQFQLRQRNLLKTDPNPLTQERLIKMFASDEKQVDLITHLIDNMLDITRISSGKFFLKTEPFDLCELVRDLIERSSEQFVAAGCPIEMDLCPSAVGNWDRFRIEQLLLNLLTNAMRYGAGKPIFLQVTVSLDRARILVRDQGRGIAEENHTRIFQRFERAEKKDKIKGLGLGLYIAKQIVEVHRGLIRVESILGQGATFVVELPLLKQNKAA
ncbi:MAG: hybrid sensor histidine kinase/response regulator [Bdellovibrionales bacterium GWB1_52_6]|nr:MAG: hybrid sensor histidine kinase/response regulator [Bdellovibrionales bacterium GWB1_52_6]OFZ05870.1 MAG: hybrid sensor histidine kinase/response regulator [Bdellovibrionales bacterium GWA1_52_35]HCM39760.1 hybrid sensor histidine kinase/response regulator [Bdellovibrionales bacterium]